MTAAEWLAQAHAVTDAATEGPWTAAHQERGTSFIETPDSRDAGDYPAAEVLGQSDAAFIAASRTMLPAAVAALEAVLALHERVTLTLPGGGDATPALHICGECSDERDAIWPCSTFAAITSALDGLS